MENFFYNITGFIVGIFLIFLMVGYFKDKNILLGSITLLHSILFIGVGVGGFFVPNDYAYITILVLLGLCVTMGGTLLLCKYKKKKTDADDESNK